MNTRPLFLVAAAVLALPASAQVYKCKTPTGGTLVSDRPCDGANKTVAVRQPEQVTPEQQMQAAEVQQRRRQQLGQIEANEAAYRARLAEREARRPPEMSPEKARLCKEASTPLKGSPGGLTASQRAVLASCAGMNVPAPAPAPAAMPSPPPGVVTSCDPGGCWDSNGKRYNNAGGAGNFHRQDGRFCQQVGNQMQCN